MTENKRSRYIKYAIGEIVLVVLGILIALQLNNWNEVRKQANLKDNYLERLINDLKQDTSNINYVISGLNENQDIISKLIKAVTMESEDHTLDTIIVDYFKKGWIISEFVATSNTYTDLSQTSNMRIIENTALMDDILEYYGYIRLIDNSTTINKNWITPLDLEVAKLTAAFELDPTTSPLFTHKSRKEAIKDIKANHKLMERSAAGHFWINASLNENLVALKGVCINLLEVLNRELNWN